MKPKLLLTFVLGSLLSIGCSVDPIDEELLEPASASANLEATEETYGCAGPDNSITMTIREAKSIPNIRRVTNVYLSLLAPGVSQDGEFQPSIRDIIRAFDAERSGGKIGEYTTTYSLNSADCSDSVELTITVIPDGSSDPTCVLSAGTDSSKTLTQSEADAIPSWDEVRKLYLSLLDKGVSREGQFEMT